MTKASKSVFAGRPLASTCITSAMPMELMVTRPLALGMQLAATAPADGTMLKVVFWAATLALNKLTAARPMRTRFVIVFIGILLIVFFSWRGKDADECFLITS